MSWQRRFRAGQFVRGSIWLIPVLGGVAGSLLGLAAVETSTHTDLPCEGHAHEELEATWAGVG